MSSGALAVDVCLLLTLYGVCTTYLITATQLLGDTPLTMGYAVPFSPFSHCLNSIKSLPFSPPHPSSNAIDTRLT